MFNIRQLSFMNDESAFVGIIKNARNYFIEWNHFNITSPHAKRRPRYADVFSPGTAIVDALASSSDNPFLQYHRLHNLLPSMLHSSSEHSDRYVRVSMNETADTSNSWFIAL